MYALAAITLVAVALTLAAVAAMHAVMHVTAGLT